MIVEEYWHGTIKNYRYDGDVSLQTLPPSKISDILRVGGRTVMSGVPNVGGIDFGRVHG